MWHWAVTLTLDFEGQISKKLYHRNERVDWHKRMWIHRMLDPSCDFKLLSHPWPWPWIFKVKFLIPIFRNGKVDWFEMEEMWVGYNIGCTMGFLLAHSAWQIDQFPTCWPMNGLFVHLSRGWGVLSFSERLVLLVGMQAGLGLLWWCMCEMVRW